MLSDDLIRRLAPWLDDEDLDESPWLKTINTHIKASVAGHSPQSRECASVKCSSKMWLHAHAEQSCKVLPYYASADTFTTCNLDWTYMPHANSKLWILQIRSTINLDIALMARCYHLL